MPGNADRPERRHAAYSPCRPETIVLLSLQMLESDEVTLRSFGRVSQVVPERPKSWREATSTLYDSAIFGPRRSWICECGDVNDRIYKGTVCPNCGVRVGNARLLRSRRFGHIELGSAVKHPLIERESFRILPVVPAALRAADCHGADLNQLYSEVLIANSKNTSRKGERTLQVAVDQLFRNEWLENPVTCQGRVLRSLLWCFSMEAVNSLRRQLYLMGLMSAVRISASDAPVAK